MEIAELRSKIKAYKPGDAVTVAGRILFPGQLLIGLFGKTNSAKTSLINSMYCAVNTNLRRAKLLPVAPPQLLGGHTPFRDLMPLTQHISVIDNRGLNAADFEDYLTEFDAQLGNS